MVNSNTLKKLQYTDILQQVSQYAISSIARQRILDTLPCTEYEETVTMLQEVEQAYQLYGYHSSFDLSIDDVTQISQLARVRSTLTMGQLLCVMRQLKTSRLLQNSLLTPINNVDTSILMAKASLLYINQALESEIDSAIISEDEMDDRASSDLYDIRRKIKNINAEIKQKLAGYTKQSSLSPYLQDSIVTMRGDRYVIPVKQEYKGYVNGIVHDQSASGATLFVEPMAIVQLNNNLRTAIIEEKEEVARILASFTARVAPIADKLILNQDIISGIDVVFAKVKYAVATKSTKPVINNDGYINIFNARHPLLDTKKVVPISITLGRDFDIVVVTGPNTGGKTVSLKTTALMCLLAMTAMYIPCSEESVVSFFDDIYCDIGDEQSIEQSLSTFSSHIVNISNILKSCNNKSLVLIDEVGAGTEPNEGTALALAITEYLRNSGAKCILTTHYGQLKEYALSTDRVINASMEFDTKTFEPTYRLIVGVPGSSNAIAIAKRLGIDDKVIQYAQSNISSDKQAFEKVLANAETLRQHYEQQSQEITQLKVQLEQQLAQAKRQNDSLTKERDKLLAHSRQEAKQIVQDARVQCQEIIAQLKNILNRSQLDDSVLFEARAVAKEVNDINIQGSTDDGDEVVFWGDNVPFDQITVGKQYYAKSLGVVVTVVSISSKNKITVRAGALTSTVSVDNLYFSTVESKKPVVKTNKVAVAPKNNKVEFRSSANEIHCLGQRVDEAVANIDIFIDNCIRNGFATVWIIHGMGTGRLRQGIHQYLRGNSRVKSFRLGQYGEGESGVTVVTLK